MTLLQLIRLLTRNALALTIVPISLAALVFLLTMKQDQTYITKTRIYTGLASGYSIENQGNSRVDFFAVNNAFDNLINIIKARSTMEETSLSLMAQHISLKEPEPKYISKVNYKKLIESFPRDLKWLVNKRNYAETYNKIAEHAYKTDTNYFQQLFTSDHPHYSIKAISKCKVWRVQNSDIIELEFESNDPGICQNTLMKLSDVFITKFASIRINQTDQVVDYFENQLEVSAAKLSRAEDKLLNFNQKNNIINYNEQTKNISARKEEIDKEYYEMQMKLAGSNAVIDKLEEQLGSHNQLKLNNKVVLRLRKQIADVSSRIAFARIPSPNEPEKKADPSELVALTTESDSLKQALAAHVDSLIAISQTPDGVSAEELLKQWLYSVIQNEENSAMREVIQQRRDEFLEIYKTFAPLGATLKRIEREINVVEQEYLQQLHSLALAKLRQQNNLMASNVRIIDKPDFPLKPESSKRKILILAAFMFGFIIVAFTILVLAYINPNIQTPQNAERKTKLSVAGILPMEDKTGKINYRYVKTRLLDMWIQSLFIEIAEKPDKKPWRIAIGSSREAEGKSYAGNGLSKALRKANMRVMYLTYLGEEEMGREHGVDDFQYNIDQEFIKKQTIYGLLPNANIDLAIYDFVLIELPPINETPYPQALMRNIDMYYLVLNVNRAWTKADEYALSILTRVLVTEPRLFLNGVSYDVVEDYITAVPKKRGRIRRTVLRILRLQFFRKLLG